MPARASFTRRSAITHRLDVRRYAAQKRAALAAHPPPGLAGPPGGSGHAFWALDRLPLPLFRLLLGREWLTEPRSAPGTRRTRIL